jgi:acyl dehydratase
MTSEPDLRPGLAYPDWRFSVGRAEQAEKLRLCGIDPRLHGDQVDVTHLATAAILLTKRAGFTIIGNVHVGQWFGQVGPVPLDQPVTLAGTVESVEPVAKGTEVRTEFTVTLADGSVPLRMERLTLRLDPDRSENPKKPSGAAPRQPSDEGDVLRRLALRPADVAAYSGDGDNLIHSDPAVARQFGFRAPIAGGLMAVRLMLAALKERCAADRLDMSVGFRRPMFWDDTLVLRGRLDPATHTGTMAVTKSDGKTAVTATVPACA